MLGYCRLCQGNFLNDVAADTMVFIQKKPDDSDPRWMCEGLAELCCLDMVFCIMIPVTHLVRVSVLKKSNHEKLFSGNG